MLQLNKSINSVALIGSLISYQTVVMNKFYDRGFSKNYVAGALTSYDIPDLMGCIAPRKIAVIGFKDQVKQPASGELFNKELSFPRSVFSQKNVPGNINIMPDLDNLSTVVEWCLR